MSPKDRRLLQDTFKTAAHAQERGDKIAARKSAALTAATDVINTYGRNQNTEEVIVARTGVTPAQAAEAIAEVERTGRVRSTKDVDFTDPQYDFENRVKHGMKKFGLTRAEAEEQVRNVILYKEQERLIPAGTTVRIDQLALGQRFLSEGREGKRVMFSYTGCVIYKNPSRVRVLLDPGPKKETRFVSNKTGEEVTFSAGGRVERNIAPDCPVEVLAGREDLALLHAKKVVQSDGSSNSNQTGDNTMPKTKKAKKAKKATTKTNGAAAGRPRLSEDAVVKRLKGPNDEQIKRHVTILTVLKEAGDKMSLKELGKAFAKASGTKQDGTKVFLMHRKALVDGGFISVTEPTAA